MNSFFLNFSDGEPTEECNETQKHGGQIRYNKYIVNKIRELGIEVISYFISKKHYSDMTDSGSYRTFKNIYGFDSNIIDTANLNQLAKTMNDKFLKK